MYEVKNGNHEVISSIRKSTFADALYEYCIKNQVAYII